MVKITPISNWVQAREVKYTATKSPQPVCDDRDEERKPVKSHLASMRRCSSFYNPESWMSKPLRNQDTPEAGFSWCQRIHDGVLPVLQEHYSWVPQNAIIEITAAAIVAVVTQPKKSGRGATVNRPI